MAPPPASSAATGAPAVSRDGFSYVNGELFALASGQNLHRRAAVQEIDTHFTSGNERDHPGHWFEAQLIHYGLPPSKTKSVARMRLFDAVKKGGLIVPSTIVKLEAQLKKEWTKNNQEVKKLLKASSSTGTKRKTGAEPAEGLASTVKKAKTTTATTSTSQKATTKSTTSKTAPKEKAGRKSGTDDSVKKPTARRPKSVAVKEEPNTTSSVRQTARARRGGISQGARRGTSSAASQEATRGEPTTFSTPQFARRGGSLGKARRSGSFAARGRVMVTEHEFDGDDDDHDSFYSSSSSEPSRSPSELGSLGLLNGDYDLTSEYVSEEWPDVGRDFSLTLTLSGSSLWGKFDLGVVEGVFYLPERPFESSFNKLEFSWRGRENGGEGEILCRNRGSVTFLGNGAIEGEIDHLGITFHGRRAPGQGTTSQISARKMKEEWDGYSEEQYEYENRARWGGRYGGW